MNNFIDSSDPKSLNKKRQNIKRFYNTSIFENCSVDFFERDCLNKNHSNMLSKLLPKIRDL